MPTAANRMLPRPNEATWVDLCRGPQLGNQMAGMFCVNKNMLGIRRFHATGTILSTYCAELGTVLMFKMSVAVNAKRIQLCLFLKIR